MKALAYDRYGPPEVLALRDMPEPRAAAGQLLIRVRAVPVGPGDCKLRAGLLRQHLELTFPKVPGRYGVGEIAAIGEGIGEWRIGEPVVFASLHADSGSAAELVARSPSQCARPPQNLSAIETAALIQGGVSALAALEAGNVGKGTRILILGAAGAVGSATIEIASHLGASITAVCRSTDRDFVLGLGAHAAIAFDTDDLSAAREQDVVIDLVGGRAHEGSYQLLKRGGRLVYLIAEPFVDRGADFGVSLVRARIDDGTRALDAVCRLAERGVVAPRIADAMDWSRAAEAHSLVEQARAKHGRLVLTL